MEDLAKGPRIQERCHPRRHGTAQAGDLNVLALPRAPYPPPSPLRLVGGNAPQKLSVIIDSQNSQFLLA